MATILALILPSLTALRPAHRPPAPGSCRGSSNGAQHPHLRAPCPSLPSDSVALPRFRSPGVLCLKVSGHGVSVCTAGQIDVKTTGASGYGFKCGQRFLGEQFALKGIQCAPWRVAWEGSWRSPTAVLLPKLLFEVLQ